ncbi:MAG: efflux RND transporter permease subunit [Patescibacteria group bacterium]
MIEKLVSYSLKNRTLIFVILIFLVLFGIYSYVVADREVFPNVDLSTLIIQSNYPSANAKEVYTNITEPIYNAIKSTSGIKDIQENANNGYTTIIVTSHYGVNLSQLEQSINQDIQSVKLPQQASTPSVSQFNFSDIPILELSFSGKNRDNFVKNTIVPYINTVSGVSSVSYYGNQTQEFKINLNYNKLIEYNISASTVENIIKSFNINSPIGSVISKNITEPVTIYSNVANIHALNNAMISHYNGQIIKLKDIATLNIVSVYNNQIVETNGQKSDLVDVLGQQNINTTQVISTILNKIKQINPKGIKYQILSNDTSTINSTINGISKETLLGIILAIFVIFIFLKSGNITLIASLSIPISIFFTLTLMNVQNITFNIMSLSGLSVALGRIFDDSIVVIETIFRHISEDVIKDEKLLINSVKEVGGAITSSTLTTIGVFLPIAFVGGITSSFFVPFAFTASSALLASLFTAIIVIPIFSAIFLLRKNVKLKKKEFFLIKYYERLINLSLDHKILTILITLILIVSSLLLIPFIKTGFIPSPTQPSAIVSGSIKAGSSKTETYNMALKLVNYIKTVNNVSIYSVSIGLLGNRGVTLNTAPQNNKFQIFVNFKNNHNINNEISNIENFANKIHGLKSQVNLLSAVGNLNSVALSINSSNQNNLYKANNYLLNKLKGLGGISNISSNLSQNTYQKQIALNNNLMSQNFLSSIQVLSQISPYFTPVEIQNYNINGSLYNTYIYVNNLPNISNIYINNSIGDKIPLSKIAIVENKKYSSNITYENGSRASVINALITAKNTQKVNSSITKYINKAQSKYNVTIKNQGSSSEQASSFNSLFVAMGISVFIVLVIMIATFSSIIEPIAILFSLPVTIIGVLVALFITDSTLDLPSLIGMLMLIGIVVTNAIVLLTKIKQNIIKGDSIRQAIIEGGKVRLRPILMTAITTIFALLPLALFSSTSTLIGKSLAITVIGGLFTSTFLTLFIVPVIYSILKRSK